jgi:hypothetical protein
MLVTPMISESGNSVQIGSCPATVIPMSKIFGIVSSTNYVTVASQAPWEDGQRSEKPGDRPASKSQYNLRGKVGLCINEFIPLGPQLSI